MLNTLSILISFFIDLFLQLNILNILKQWLFRWNYDFSEKKKHVSHFFFLNKYVHLNIHLTIWQYLVSPSPIVAENFFAPYGCQWIVLDSCHIHDLFSSIFYSRRVRRILWTVRSTWPTTWCSIYCVWRRSTRSTCWRNPSTSSSTIEPCLVLWRVRTVMIERNVSHS